MKKLILLTLIVLSILFSASAIYAGDINCTDSENDNTAVSEPVSSNDDLLDTSDENSVTSSDSEDLKENIQNSTESEDLKENNETTESENLTESNQTAESESSNQSTNTTIKTITSKNIVIYYKSTTKYTATFLNSNGSALSNTAVTLNLNNKLYQVKTNSKGVASLSISLKPGTYNIIAYNPATGYSLKNTVKVLSTITSSNMCKVYTDSKKFTAKFLKSNGKALAKKYIKFKIKGKTYKVKTNSKGVAKLSLKTLKKGTYKIICYNKDGLTAKNTIKVVKKGKTLLETNYYVFLKSKSKKVSVKLLDKYGYTPSSGKIIKIKINGKKYTKKTNSKSIAKFKLPKLAKGIYKIKYTFSGAKYYYKSSATNKIVVLPSKKTALTVKSTKKFGYGAGTSFQVQLTGSKLPIAKKTIKFTVNGKTYSKKTSSSGIASIPINLPIGTYTIKYTFSGASNLNKVSSSAKISVVERTPTKITWKSQTSIYTGTNTVKILLTDENNKALSGQSVKLTINSKTYTSKTSSNGYASFKTSITTAGNITVTVKFGGDNTYAPNTTTQKISVTKFSYKGYGYWVRGDSMKSVNLSELASKGTTDLFLNSAAIKNYGQTAVETWVSTAKNLGMRVHIWMQTFYSNKTWVNPVINGSPNTAYFNQVIAEAKKYASITGVAGIHFDYLRYPGNAYKTTGGTAAISTFVKKATDAIHDVNSACIISAALMPETTSNAYYYGQDYSVLSQYLDVVIPMIYKGNYKKTTSWIKTTTEWFVKNSKYADVWSGLQTYVSDSNITKLSASELTADFNAAISAGAKGAILFRYGLTEYLDFKSIT